MQTNLNVAQDLDWHDTLTQFRKQFHLPAPINGRKCLYFCGNSLGLQPKSVRTYIEQELWDWERLGVEGHFHAKNPWLPYHEFLTPAMAKIVGAKPIEVVCMNTLTTNLHLMMVSFYRPTTTRFKILMESDAFPSDRYAIESQLRFHGFLPENALVELRPREGEVLLRAEDIEECLATQGNEIALILLGGVNYYTGQVFAMKEITRLGHQYGCRVGFDLAHGAGNIQPNLHDSNADFAVWCSYKYLNSGPGSLAGCFVHERHAYDFELPRFAGWWGHNKETRFNMRHAFDPIPGAEGWQLSNPPILPLAAMRASLELFDAAGMEKLLEKSQKLTNYLAFLIEKLQEPRLKIITPSDPAQRGCQLSIQVKNSDKRLFNAISEAGVIADWREPDVIRVAPVPLYNTFEEVFEFVKILEKALAV
jgi:kynureninase